jgi:hypothetical protein
VAVRPRTRVATSHGPTRVDGASAVDRYLLALAGYVPTGRYAFDALERDFVENAKRFGASRGISYGAWRDVGVPPEVLARAGVGASAFAG